MPLLNDVAAYPETQGDWNALERSNPGLSKAQLITGLQETLGNYPGTRRQYGSSTAHTLTEPVQSSLAGPSATNQAKTFLPSVRHFHPFPSVRRAISPSPLSGDPPYPQTQADWNAVHRTYPGMSRDEIITILDEKSGGYSGQQYGPGTPRTGGASIPSTLVVPSAPTRFEPCPRHGDTCFDASSARDPCRSDSVNVQVTFRNGTSKYYHTSPPCIFSLVNYSFQSKSMPGAAKKYLSTDGNTVEDSDLSQEFKDDFHPGAGSKSNCTIRSMTAGTSDTSGTFRPHSLGGDERVTFGNSLDAKAIAKKTKDWLGGLEKSMSEGGLQVTGRQAASDVGTGFNTNQTHGQSRGGSTG